MACCSSFQPPAQSVHAPTVHRSLCHLPFVCPLHPIGNAGSSKVTKGNGTFTLASCFSFSFFQSFLHSGYFKKLGSILCFLKILSTRLCLPCTASHLTGSVTQDVLVNAQPSPTYADLPLNLTLLPPTSPSYYCSIVTTKTETETLDIRFPHWNLRCSFPTPLFHIDHVFCAVIAPESSGTPLPPASSRKPLKLTHLYRKNNNHSHTKHIQLRYLLHTIQ